MVAGRRTALLLAALLAIPPGCVTRALWDTWPDPPQPAGAPVPVRIEQAVRTGEGAFHVLATYSDGSTRHLAVRPFDAPTQEAEAWPDAIRRSDILGEFEGPLPQGAPLRVADAAAGASEDVDASEAAEPGEVISLERDALRVVNAAGESWTLATFSPPPAAPVVTQDDPARQRVIVVFFTPFTLAIDAAIALVVFGPMVPVVARELLDMLDGS